MSVVYCSVDSVELLLFIQGLVLVHLTLLLNLLVSKEKLKFLCTVESLIFVEH